MEITLTPELKSTAKEDGSHSIYIRITQNRKHRRVPTSISIEKKYWDAKKHRVVKHSFAKSINEEIEIKIQELRQFITKSNVLGKTLNPKIVQKQAAGTPSESFFTFATIVLERVKARNYGTWQQYECVINKLKKQLKGQNITFEEVTVTLLKSHQTYLQGIGNSKTTVYNSFKVIKAILYQAIQEDLLTQDKNPFFRFKISPGKADRVKLSESEIEAIELVELEQGCSKWHVRNFFLLSYYCMGMRMRDVLTLQWKHIEDGRITYRMSKNEKTKSIFLIDKAKKILDFYHAEAKERSNYNKNKYVFHYLNKGDEAYKDDMIFSKHVNSIAAHLGKELRVIALMCGIDKKIASHTARHSFSENARKRGVPISMISEFLNHSSIKTTELYLGKDDGATQDAFMKQMFTSMNDKDTD